MRSCLSLGALCCLMLCCCTQPEAIEEQVAASTPEDRAALFDLVLEKTSARESFSPVKNEALGLDVEAEMRKYREEMVAADNDERLFYALAKLSNARKDRHLRISLVEGGLRLAHTAGIAMENYPAADSAILHAPVRLATDYGTPGEYFVFVSDTSTDIAEQAEGETPEVGDRVVGVNGRSFSEYLEAVEPYHRYSTINGLWWQLATWLPQKSYQFPPDLYRQNLALELEREDGQRYSVTLPYLAPDTIDWHGHGARHYPGFHLEIETSTFDLYLHDEGSPVLLLSWHGFREGLVTDVDRLMEYARDNGLLGHAIIWDGTRSRGGSKGPYAVQRLSPRPFKTTFGNLRISDVTQPFIEEKREQYEAQQILDSGVTETIDDGTWLMEWLEADVSEAMHAGEEYSNNVPFKLAHAPKTSDGVLQPADVHFTGPMVCLLGPYGGSHLDQFAAIVADNDLAHIIGMPAGGYSNTWEWQETLVFPISGQPVVGFMWSIGHTIRPNGEILEGNPAAVDEYLPVTRENYLDYYPTLISRALELLGTQ